MTTSYCLNRLLDEAKLSLSCSKIPQFNFERQQVIDGEDEHEYNRGCKLLRLNHAVVRRDEPLDLFVRIVWNR